MLTIVIDGVECPVVGDVTLPGYRASRLESCEAWREGDSLTLWIASTPATDKLFGYFCDMHRHEEFNDSYHRATLETNGTQLITGMATLLGYSDTKGNKLYNLRIRTGGSEWAERAATTRLNEVGLDTTTEMTLPAIEASWSEDSALRFLPLWRDSYPKSANTSLYEPQRSIMPHNYHPFLSIRHIFERIIGDSGYKIQSNFLSSPIFERLMISGAYRTVDTELAEQTMGFIAYRTSSTTATANSLGRVNIRGPQGTYSCGAIVDTASPTASDEEGNTFGNAYNNNGVLHLDTLFPVFTPTREIETAFDIHLKYISDYNIASRDTLQGFDTITPCAGCTINLKLRNPFEDCRSSVMPNTSYKLLIFGNIEGYEFRLGNPVIVTTTQRETTILTPADVSSSLRLYYRTATNPYYQPYLGEWALYHGHVETTGKCYVEIDIRTPFQRYTPTSPKRFNDIFIGGGEAGQQLTLCSGCSVRPIFSGAVGYGEIVKYEDVANHDMRVEELMNAVKHMFNLRFYAHEPTKTLYIEPYDDMDDGKVVDWRSRQVAGSQRLISRITECFVDTCISYLPPDGVTQRSAGDEQIFGEWNFHIASYAAKQGKESITSPLFMPTISLTGYSSSAPSAKVLTIGDRDVICNSDYVEPRVVVYQGAVALPAGEKWESFGKNSVYPLATFHDPDTQTSLCFEDRDGCQGLNSYYLNELREKSQRELLCCDILIDANEYAALFDPNSAGASILSRFRLDMQGASSLFKLEEVAAYNPATGIATCTFRRTLHD